MPQFTTSPTYTYNLSDIYFFNDKSILNPATIFYKEKKYQYLFTKNYRDKIDVVKSIETKSDFEKYCRIILIRKRLSATQNGVETKNQAIIFCFNSYKNDETHQAQNYFISEFKQRYSNEVVSQKNLDKIQRMETFRNSPVIYYTPYLQNKLKIDTNLGPKFLNANFHGVSYNDKDVTINN